MSSARPALEIEQWQTFQALVHSVAELLDTYSDDALAKQQERDTDADIVLRNKVRAAAHAFVAADSRAVAATTTYLPRQGGVQ